MSVTVSRRERLSQMLEYLLDHDEGSPNQLAERFGVSLMTIHRDLDELQRRGQVRKYHNGVTVERTRAFELPAALRRRMGMDVKRALAAHAVRMVKPGEVLMLDCSTTVAEMADGLSATEGLRIVTTYMPVIRHFVDIPTVDLNVIGGEYDQNHEAFMGIATVRSIQDLRVDTAFVSTTTADRVGLYHQEEGIVVIKRAMLAVARRRVLLMEGSKLGSSSLHLLGGWDQIDELVTDVRADAATLDGARDAGVQVTVLRIPGLG